MRTVITAAASVALLWMIGPSSAADQLKIVSGFPAGSGLDVVTRIIAEKLRSDTGMNIIVENRPGGGGRAAAEFVAKADQDAGLVILSAPIVTTAFSPFVFKNLAFDPLIDLAPVTRLGTFKFTLAVNNTVPANSVAEFIKYVKANPGKISYGSLSAGTPSHFLGAMFNRSTGTDILHVPYRGSGPATVALLANEVHAVFNTTAASMEMYKAGKIKLLAVTGAERSPALPDVPTFRELKLDLGAIEEADMWYGFLAPGKMPRATVLELNGMIRKALDDPTVRARLLTLDIEAVTDTPEDFAKIVRDDYERWGGIIRASGFTLSE